MIRVLCLLVAMGASAYAQPEIKGGCPANATGCSVTASGATASLTNAARAALALTPYDFGGKGHDDCVTDSTAAIVALFAATPAGGVARIPATITPGGCWLVSSTGSEIFLLTNPIHILFDGYGGAPGGLMQIGSSTGNTTDIFHIKPGAYPSTESYQLINPSITQNSGTHGRYVVNLDDTGAGTFIRNTAIISPNFPTTLGDAIHLTHSSGNAGVFGLLVAGPGSIAGCVDLNGVGDGVSLVYLILSGSGCAVYLNQQAGAGNFAMEHNIVASTGMIEVDGGVNPIIAFNEFEQQAANTEANNAMIDLNGASGNLTGAKVLSNQVQNLSTSGSTPTLLRIAAAPNTLVDGGNRFSQPSTVTQPDIVITGGGAAGTIVGSAEKFVTNLGGAATYVTVTQPAITSCGTGSPSLSAQSTDQKGTISVGGGAVTSCVLTFATPRSVAPVCTLSALSSGSAALGVSILSRTTNAISITTDGSSVGGGSIDYACQ